MKLPPFDYHEPRSLDELLLFLKQHGDCSKILAGGTNVIAQMKSRRVVPRYLINIKNINELCGITLRGSSLHIGPLTTIREIERSNIIKRSCPLLSHAACEVGSPTIRNRATIGGNLCNASPYANLPPALQALDAKLRITGLEGNRLVSISEFYVGRRRTVLKPTELLSEIIIPANSRDNISHAFIKLPARSYKDLASAIVAVVVEKKYNICSSARISVGAVWHFPQRAGKAEDYLRGKPLDYDVTSRAAEIASDELSYMTDIRASAEYRREVVRVLVDRALKQVSRGVGFACEENKTQG